MASTTNRPQSRVETVGNIPYDFSEDQLREVFQEVGPVQSIRLVLDRETGKPRGYGFIEYLDAETAASAVRNLHNTELGGRQLRVDYADNDPAQQEGVTPLGMNPNQPRPVGVQAPPVHFALPSLAGTTGAGVSMAMLAAQASSLPTAHTTNTSATGAAAAELATAYRHPTVPASTDVIHKVLGTLSPGQLLEIVIHLKVLARANPIQARQLLQQNPQLSYAVLECLLTLNLVDTTVVQSLLGIVSSAPPQMAVATPPPPLLAAAPMPMMSQPVDPSLEQQQMLMAVLNYTPQQIEALPPPQKELVLKLRAQIAGQLR